MTQAQCADGPPPLTASQEPTLLHGVDVSRSALLRDARVAAAARFAAAAHEGQVRKTGEPYVAHCIEAALIVERNLPRREPDADRCGPPGAGRGSAG
jgi:hypothetical protein